MNHVVNKKKILVCPLDWGLGHASRCIPIIQYYLHHNCEVIVGADKRPFELLKKEFPQQEFIRLKGYEITYPKKSNLTFSIIGSIPKILIGIFREHLFLKKIIREKKIDLVISDNRFGLWNKKVKSIFITHQVFIPAPFAKGVINRINRFFIEKYNECWIPDHGGEENLSGKLSHGVNLPGNAFFIGPLSRFNTIYKKEEVNDHYKYDLMVILSGPEPKRTYMERQLLSILMDLPLKIIVVCGVPEKQTAYKPKNNIDVFSHLDAKHLYQAMTLSEIILCNSGYSTLMDLTALKKKAILIPTPGQPEQEYLAAYMDEKKYCFTTTLYRLSLPADIDRAKQLKGLELPSSDNLDRLGYHLNN